jgi:hypothetical protein
MLHLHSNCMMEKRVIFLESFLQMFLVLCPCDLAVFNELVTLRHRSYGTVTGGSVLYLSTSSVVHEQLPAKLISNII